MTDEPAGTYARHICQRLLIDRSWNSSRLEGNTYCLLETEQLFQAGHSGDAVGDPDPFRVKYRQAIAGQVAEIIRTRCSRRRKEFLCQPAKQLLSIFLSTSPSDS